MLWINRSPIVADLTKSWFKQREKKNWYLQFWEFSKPQINFVTQLLSSSFFLSRLIRTRTIDGKFFTTRVWNVVSPRVNFGCEYWWRENIQKNCIDGRYVIAVWFEGVAWNECVSCPSEDTLPTFLPYFLEKRQFHDRFLLIWIHRYSGRWISVTLFRFLG